MQPSCKTSNINQKVQHKNFLISHSIKTRPADLKIASFKHRLRDQSAWDNNDCIRYTTRETVGPLKSVAGVLLQWQCCMQVIKVSQIVVSINSASVNDSQFIATPFYKISPDEEIQVFNSDWFSLRGVASSWNFLTAWVIFTDWYSPAPREALIEKFDVYRSVAYDLIIRWPKQYMIATWYCNKEIRISDPVIWGHISLYFIFVFILKFQWINGTIWKNIVGNKFNIG